MSSSKRKKPSQPSHREDTLREQLQACSHERDILVQQQQLLLDERDLLYQRLMQVAVTDVMTGLPNHQAVVNQLEEALLGYQQTGGSCALLFMDLDHFKRVNDRWGHRAGDGLLQAIAQRLQPALLPQDVVGRYGGDEFLILLPGGDVPGAIQTANYLRALIGSHSYCWQPSDGSGTVEISTTLSIGIAISPLNGTSADTLLEVADRAMYQAKYSGRNRVYLADGVTASPQSLHNEKEYLAVRALTAVASVHNGDMHAHAQRLVHLIEATACQMKRPEEEIHLLRLAALLHDIGKIGVPQAIVCKASPLTQQEWALMRQHPELGCQMLEQVGGVFGQLVHIVGTHHERWDGQGYPNGLAQEAIPMSARILAVVDAYDAMISPRPYRREPLTHAETITELQQSAGRQFDPHVVEAFLSMLAEQENQPSPLAQAKAAGTREQPTPTLQVPTGKEWQSVAEIRGHLAYWREHLAYWRGHLAYWREQLAEMHQQQAALQQRLEALQQRQHYLAWRKQERERQRQEPFWPLRDNGTEKYAKAMNEM